MDAPYAYRCRLVLLPLLLAAACTEPPRDAATPQPLTEVPGEVPGEWAGEMVDFHDRVERDLYNLDLEIDHLRLQMESDAASLSDSFRVRVAGLQYRRDALETELRSLPETAEDQLESRRESIEYQWNHIVEDLESLRLTAITERDAFERAINARMAELEMELSDFQRYTSSEALPNPERHVETMQTLQDDFAELSGSLDTLKTAPDETFEARRAGLADAVADFGARIREATNEARQQGDQTAALRSS